MKTIEHIRNPARKSGFDHVNSAKSGEVFAQQTNRTNADNRWRATCGWEGSNAIWRGPVRPVPEQAAQDYCDYVNGGTALPSAPALKRPQRPIRPVIQRRVQSQVERELRKALREEIAKNPGPVVEERCYLIGIKNDTRAVKIGHAADPLGRVNDLQTGNPYELRLLADLPGGEAKEKRLHAKHIRQNILNEWFRPSTALLSEFGLTAADYTRKIGP